MTHVVTLEESHRGFSQPLPDTCLPSPPSPLCSEALLVGEPFSDHPMCHCTLHPHTPTSLPCLIVFHSLSFYDMKENESHSVVSHSLWPHGLQHARPPCPSPTPRAYSNLCPPNRWCHPIISSSVIPVSSHLQSCPASGSFPVGQVFSSESVLCSRWPKYCSFSFSISLSSEYSGLISFRMDWLDLLAIQGILKSLLQQNIIFYPRLIIWYAASANWI